MKLLNKPCTNCKFELETDKDECGNCVRNEDVSLGFSIYEDHYQEVKKCPKEVINLMEKKTKNWDSKNQVCRLESILCHIVNIMDWLQGLDIEPRIKNELEELKQKIKDEKKSKINQLETNDVKTLLKSNWIKLDDLSPEEFLKLRLMRELT